MKHLKFLALAVLVASAGSASAQFSPVQSEGPVSVRPVETRPTVYAPVQQSLGELLAAGFTISAMAGSDGEFLTLVRADTTGAKWIHCRLFGAGQAALAFSRTVSSACRALN